MQSSPPPVGTQGLTACSPFLLTLPYFTADCSCGNWNEDELQAAGKVPGHPGRAAARGAATLPERYGVRGGRAPPGSPPAAQPSRISRGCHLFFCFALENQKLSSPASTPTSPHLRWEPNHRGLAGRRGKGAVVYVEAGLRRLSPVAQTVKNPPAVQEIWVQSLCWKDPLEKAVAAHSSIHAWRIPWTEEPSKLQSMGLHRVRYN